ncbi:MAG: hypothetical protein M0R74_16910, partial [Dehalococcoidia bacterium]|nr:hypothetical protein [Dehalococcoidia bacterium]
MMTETFATSAARPGSALPAVSVDRVSKRYRMVRQTFNLKTAILHPSRWFGTASRTGHWAVRDVSFEVLPGEFFSIVGA